MEIVRSVRFEEESCKTESAGCCSPSTPRTFNLIDITNHYRRHIDNTTTMSAVSRTIGSRLLTPALRPSAARAIAPTYRTYSTNEPIPHEHKTSSDDSPAVKLNTESTQIREENAAEGMRHQPDYNVAVDYRTSCVTLHLGFNRACS
jgi:hypothetical protein